MLASPAADVADALARDRRRRRWSGSSTAPASRPTAATARCASSPATSTRSPTACRRWSTSSPALPGGDLVLDGEALGVDDDGSPRRFQDTMGDFGADAVDRPRRRARRPTSSTCSTPTATSLVDEPLAARRAVLAAVVPADVRLPSIVTADAGGGGGVPRRRRRRRPRGRDGQGARRAVRRRPARRGVAQGQAGAHPRPRGAGRRVGPRPAHAGGCRTSTSAPAATTARS